MLNRCKNILNKLYNVSYNHVLDTASKLTSYVNGNNSNNDNNTVNNKRVAKRDRSKVSNVYVGTVTDYDDQLNGVVKPEDAVGALTLTKPVMVRNAVLGEKVELKVFRWGGPTSEGRAYQILERSPHRTEPVCQHFGLCKGCTLMHMSPQHQLQHKRLQLCRVFSEAGISTPIDEDVIQVENGDVGYRRRTRLAVRWNRKSDNVDVGFVSELKPSFQVERCHVLEPSIQTLPLKLSVLFQSFSKNAKTNIPSVEATVADNATAIIVRNLVELLPEEINGIKQLAKAEGLVAYLQPEGYPSIKQIYPEQPIDLVFRPVDNLDVKIKPYDFLQINSKVNRLMVQQAIQYLDLNDKDIVFDLFGGKGNFSYPIGLHASHIYSMDISRLPSTTTQLNNNVTGINLNLYTDSIAHLYSEKQCNKVLMDPTRAGAEKVCQEIPSDLDTIVYVSCNPGDSLVRDLKILESKGYMIQSIKLIEMFPNTSKMEAIVLLTGTASHNIAVV
ncbi:hypothetical protein SAMD00019534_001400, partial [Acytostelium subglobosum LB1]|uniref:hypothetical protein n=1 Tax=Acytostelium subglobosum LB1 TaxID=1410327 RepID=UPI000644E3A6